ncbi:hypothetical protein [Pedobacter sp. P26]|uniref:hypothetical protein n=1 Tax=Pedobacter sp. P26 TaxID=3423956 RepID=UPI003D6759CA
MLFALLFTYLVRSGKLKRMADYSKGIPKKISLKFYRPETAILFGVILAGT